MALNPVANRGAMVKAGMSYFGGKELRARAKKKGKGAVKKQQISGKLSDASLSPVSKFRAHPSHLASPSSLKFGGNI
jgi:hypothetical protein